MDYSKDVIVAIATGKVKSAIGIIRISGHNIDSLVKKIFQKKEKNANLKDRKHHLGNIIDENGFVVDSGLLIWMPSPKSFTGEDVVELNCHGNPLILEKVLHSAIKAGARLAEPGEFTRRAFLNNKIDLIQAESVIQLINASSNQALKIANKLLSGDLSKKISQIETDIINVLKWLEIRIDFPEEDIEMVSDNYLIDKLTSVEIEISDLIISFEQGKKIINGMKVVFCGRSNVGKSSIFNKILGFKRSIVTDVPGTTRDIVDCFAELDGVSIQIQDTAGIRNTEDQIEKEGITLSFDAIKSSDLVVFISDGSNPPSSEDIYVLDFIKKQKNETIFVLNKNDISIDTSWLALNEEFINVSAKTSEGLDILKKELIKKLIPELSEDKIVLTSYWQKEVFVKSFENIKKAKENIINSLSPESISFELYEMLDHLNEIRGINSRENVINAVFADFCLGK